MTFLPQVPCPHVPMSPSQTLNTVVSWWLKPMFTGWSEAWWSWKTARRCQQLNHPKMGIESRNMMTLMVGLWLVYWLVYGWFMVGLWLVYGWFMAEYDILWYGMWWSDWLISSVFFQNCNPTWQPSLARWNAGWIQTTVQFVLRHRGEFPPFSDVKTHGPWDTWRNCYP